MMMDPRKASTCWGGVRAGTQLAGGREEGGRERREGEEGGREGIVVGEEGEKRTINNVSHNVPVPFLSTSSGHSGMILHSEKINGCTYFM